MVGISKRIFIIIGGIGLYIPVLVLALAAHADPASSAWLNIDPKLDAIRQLAPTETIPYSLNGNIDCTTRTIKTRPARATTTWPFWQDEQSHQACVTSTGYGDYAQDGLLQLPGTDIYGELRMGNPYGTRIFPAPGPSTSLVYFSGQANYASYAFIASSPQITTRVIYTGELTNILTQPGKLLTDQSGSSIPLRYDSLSYSGNGQWLIADAPLYGLVRVNLSTSEVLPFAPSFNYSSGIEPGAQTAITSDGRYAIVASRPYQQANVYDLSTCAAVPSKIAGPVRCDSRNLYPLLGQKIPHFFGISTPRFIGNDSLSLYGISKDGSTVSVSQYFLYTGDKPASLMPYLALGDSFASGEGAYEYRAATDTPDNKCHLSMRSYPYLIASELGLNKAESVACSGAVTGDIIDSSPDYMGQTKEKIKFSERHDIRSIVDGSLPGYIGQVYLEGNLRPDIITLSIGGNDVGFSDIIKRCIGPGTCYKSYEDRAELLAEIDRIEDTLISTYHQVAANTHPGAKIYVIGYPQIVEPMGNCGANVHLDYGETIFAEQLTTYLNSIIHKAADKAGVRYVDVEHALDGHRLCQAIYSDTAVNGLTSGRDAVDLWLLHGPIGNESYHPNAMGHQLLAQAILNQTNNFDKTLAGNSSQQGTSTIRSSLLAAPKSGRSIKRTTYVKQMVPTAAVPGSRISINALPYFVPNTRATITLGSEQLSTVTTQGPALAAEVELPSTIQQGQQILHVYGTNQAGDEVDQYTDIYVGEPPVSNSCGVVPDSGKDVDVDGVDDACDDAILEPPAPATQEPGSSNPQPANELQSADSPQDVSPGATDPTQQATNPQPSDSAEGSQANTDQQQSNQITGVDRSQGEQNSQIALVGHEPTPAKLLPIYATNTPANLPVTNRGTGVNEATHISVEPSGQASTLSTQEPGHVLAAATERPDPPQKPQTGPSQKSGSVSGPSADKVTVSLLATLLTATVTAIAFRKITARRQAS